MTKTERTSICERMKMIERPVSPAAGNLYPLFTAEFLRYGVEHG